jgi:hypothetical protein
MPDSFTVPDVKQEQKGEISGSHEYEDDCLLGCRAM